MHAPHALCGIFQALRGMLLAKTENEDRELTKENKTGNQDRERRQGTEMGNGDGERRQGTETVNEE